MKEIFTIFVAFLCYVHANPIVPKTDPEPVYPLDGKFTADNYEVELTIAEIAVDKTFKGKATITLIAQENTKVIQLHLNPEIKFDAANIKIKKITPNPKDISFKKDMKSDSKTHILEIKLEEEIEKDDIITLTFDSYEAPFSNDMYGFYISTYTDQVGGKHNIATTQFQPTHARRVFPCLDEPQYKATFEITINYPSTGGFHAISNQPEKTTPAPVPGKAIFETTPKMSTYLLAFVVSDFEGKEVTFENECDPVAKSHVWAPNNLVPTAKYAAEVAPKILTKLNEFTNKDYCESGIKKLDQVAIPDFSAGAMENWGLVTYRETALLIDDDKSTERNKQRVASVIAHEFAHMWFGNLVTLKSWDYTWLNEGFARYFEYFIINEVFPLWKMDEQFTVEQIHSVMVSDGFTKSHALNHPAKSENEVKAKFDSISYNKGAAVIRMLEHAAGGTAFFKDSIQEYFMTGKIKENVVPKDLYDRFTIKYENIDYNVEEFMKTWTDNPGYPIITVSADTDNKIIVTQEPFLYEKVEDKTEEAEPKLWQVWLTYATKKEELKHDALKKAMLKTADTKLTVPEDRDFLLLNVDQTGYYRVKYEGVLMEHLQKHLIKDKETNIIPTISKAQIVDDYMNFARAGRITYENAFETIAFLEHETEYLPWYAALNSFSFLRRRFAEADVRTAIDTQLQKLLETVRGTVNFEFAKPEDPTTHMAVLKKVLILQWACEINEKKCIDEARALYNTYIEDHKPTTTTIPPTTTPQTTTPTTTTTTTEVPSVAKAAASEPLNANIMSIVLCAGLRYSQNIVEEWEIVFNQLTPTTFAQEQATIVTALGCTTDEDTLKAYLEKTIDSNAFRKQDKMSVFNAVLTGNSKGVEVAYKFLKDHHKKIVENYQGLNDLTGMITNVADRLTSSAQMEEFKGLLDEIKNDAGNDITEDIIKEVKEMLETNKQWIESNSDNLKKFYKLDGDGAASLTVSIIPLLFTAFIIKKLS